MLVACQPTPCSLDPTIVYTTPPRLIERLPSPFTELSPKEIAQDWGKEFQLGKAFARQMDLYRAITCFKRALFLIPAKNKERQLEIEYEIFLAYYLGNKFCDAIETFETTHLTNAGESFPAIHDLLITLYDSYIQMDELEKANRLLEFISSLDPELAIKLSLGTAIIEGDFNSTITISQELEAENNIDQFLALYECNAKSVSKAKFLNAVLPGAGYLYVGQKNSALTSLLINTLFIAASYQLFDRGYIAGGVILSTLEWGWYYGGINGAGLAANDYNRALYETLGKESLIQNRLFPVLMIETGF